MQPLGGGDVVRGVWWEDVNMRISDILIIKIAM